MDYPANYQQQAYHPSSQIQGYDQSAHAYYAYHQYSNQQQHAYYGYPQHQQGEPTPPGVTVPQPVTQQAAEQAQNSYYYPHTVALNMDPQQGGTGGYGIGAMLTESHQPVAQASYGGTGILDGGPSRGAQGQFGSKPKVAGRPFRGRGRGRGSGKHTSVSTQASIPVAGVGQSAPVWPPPQIAWCELCRVDCNTLEILEQHRNGKKHKKNLKVYEELQRLNKDLTGGQNEQPLTFEVKPEGFSQPVESEGDGTKQPPRENLPSLPVREENRVSTENQNVEEVEPNEELAQYPRMNHYEGRGRGFKRNTRGGGRGGKWMRYNDGSRRLIEPPMPKGFVPLICELCNVKCESVITFQGHLVGKKHQSNAKRFQGHQDVIGQAALQALLPALQALYPQLQVLCQQNPNASTSLAPQITMQGFPGPEGNFALTGHSGWTQDQASTVEPVTLTAMPPPLSMENQDPQTSNLQGIASETSTQNAAMEEASSHVQSDINCSGDSLGVAATENVAAGSELVSSGARMD
ncbi:mediator of RNA polymerase II transcription subunit 12-like [Olea europaea subsp. europaea]|uniref:Mediator of RNA polymerase II transcription subunit 12-like n=1 Tax=Olea europaea subsp. europaea TaxID=158383 RepID=A0A8S0V5I0_OLEEU|nr:mediator of RNA polymerase II transcription subunit 12-like [Olea europaea subsp. europaea]